MRAWLGLDTFEIQADIARGRAIVASLSYVASGSGLRRFVEGEYAMPSLGHCLCRAVQFEFEGRPSATFHCHCESCRRATSSPMTTWLTVPRAAFRLIKGEPSVYESSPGVRRGFCAVCGSPLFYGNDKSPDEIDLLAASLGDPTSVSPARHVFVQEQLPWFEVHDQLPRYATTMRSGAPPVRHGPR